MMFHCVLGVFLIAFSTMIFISPEQALGSLAFFTGFALFAVFVHCGLNAHCGLKSRTPEVPSLSATLPRFSIIIIALTLGLIVGYLRLEAVLADQLSPELEGKTLTLEGHIVGAVESESDYVRFAFEPSSPTSPVHGRIRLSWLSMESPQTGEHWRFDLRLKRPRGLVNAGGFDYQAWLLASQIIASGYVYGKSAERLEGVDEGRVYSIRNLLSRWRSGLLQRFKDDLQPHYRSSALMLALLFGDKSGVTADHWEVFQRSGTVHLMAISGLHVGMIAFSVGLVVRTLLGPLCLCFAPQYLRAVSVGFASLAAFLYAAMAGFSVPTQRAFFCVLFLSLALLWGRRLSVFSILLMLAVVLAVLNPMALTQPGFILSFGAVATLVYAFSYRQSQAHKLRHFIKAQWLMLLVLSPVMLAFNLPVALISPVANSIAIPLMSVLILPLLFVGALLSFISKTLAEWVFTLADVGLEGLFRFLNVLAQTPTILLNTQLLSALEITAMILAALMIFSPSAFRLRAPGAFIYAVILLHAYLTPSTHTVKMDVLDVGQGLSIVLRDQRHTLVYDIGAKYSESFDIANRVLRPFLYSAGIDHIDTLIISHADNDHAGAFASFVERMPVESVYSGETDKLGLAPSQRCHTGVLGLGVNNLDQPQSALPVSYQLLWPLEGGGIEAKANNNSCVLLVRIGDYSVLLTGDIEKGVEHQLLTSGLLPKDIDVLIAGHHGSATSSMRNFVEYLNPKHVVFSAGYKNRYHHPSKKVVPRYEAIGAKLWNTAYHGGVSFQFAPDSLEVRAQRCEVKRPWYLSEGQNEDFCTF